MNDNNREIPPNATIRQEHVKCGNPDCRKSHGPYLYAYWKQDKILNKHRSVWERSLKRFPKGLLLFVCDMFSLMKFSCSYDVVWISPLRLLCKVII